MMVMQWGVAGRRKVVFSVDVSEVMLTSGCQMSPHRILSRIHITTMTSIAPAVRAARRLSPFPVRTMKFPLLSFKPIVTHSLSKIIEQCSRFGTTRRWESTATGAEPPPAGGHLPSVATSKILRSTREAALRTPGIKWLEEDGASPLRNTIGGRETRKMNLYQAVRDAMAYVQPRLPLRD